MTQRISRRTLLRGGALLATAPVLAACGTSGGDHGRTGPVEVATGAVDGPRVAAPAIGTLVMIVRHAEKPTGDGVPYGLTEDGVQDTESLTVRGWQRAGALVGLFDPRDGRMPAGLVRPSRLVAATPDPTHGSRRPAQTLTPLAQRTGQRLDTQWRKGQEAELAAALLHLDGSTLIAWEHEAIADIVSRLGSVSPGVPAWPSDRFDLVWCFTRVAGGWRFAQVPQLLLSGDSATPA